MRWTTSRGRWLLVLSALLIAAALTIIWRARQAAQRRAQQQHELELMKHGAIELMKGIGSPSKGMEQTGDPFTPRRTQTRGEKPVPQPEEKRP